MMQPPPLPQLNPYAAPAARVLDPVQTEGQELADRGTRLGAAIVDGLIFGVVGAAAGIAVAMAAGNNQTAYFAVIGAAGFAAVILIVVNCVLLHKYGQTMAKRLFKIKIVRSDGSRCELVRIIFARWLPVTLLGAIPFVGYIVQLLDPLLIFREDYRCLHDHIADTVVVKA